ncbi:MAG TPA: hypothetical protein VE986_08485, partial [Hyphomicrobiales bacterium]|nr:hypothetical protein [Hyphomicrobiales bacterium]
MIVFCADPLDGRRIDPEFQFEWDCARDSAFDLGLISYEDLVHFGNAERAVSRIPRFSEQRSALYRGWMLSPAAYEALYLRLLAKNVALITSPRQYRHCHYLPEAYVSLEGRTPRTKWLAKDEGITDQALIDMLASFGDSAVLVKDYAKSRKYDWHEAC